jgi:hypothetical protein
MWVAMGHDRQHLRPICGMFGFRLSEKVNHALPEGQGIPGYVVVAIGTFADREPFAPQNYDLPCLNGKKQTMKGWLDRNGAALDAVMGPSPT